MTTFHKHPVSNRRVVVKDGGGDAFGRGELTVAMLAGSGPCQIGMTGANTSRKTIGSAFCTGGLNRADTAILRPGRENLPTWLMAR